MSTSTSTATGRTVSLIFRIGVVCILLGGSAAVLFWLTSTRRVPPSSVLTNVEQQVQVIRVSPSSVARTWVGFGIAEARDSADVPSVVSALVREIPDSIEVGRAISTGDVIAVLDDEDFTQQAEIALRTLHELSTRQEQLDLDAENAESQVALCEEDVRIITDELERMQAAFEDKAATRREVDLIRQRLIQARGAAVQARERRDSIPINRRLLETQEAAQTFARELALRNVDRCRITSPIDGILESVEVEVGEQVDPLRRIARIVSPDRIVVPVRLPSSARSSVQVGDRVELMANGAVSRFWAGTLQRISPVDDSATRTLSVFVEPTTEEGAAPPAPGTFLAANVISRVTRPLVVVPRSAVRGERLWILDDSGRIVSLPVAIAFPIESEDGDERRLALETPVPEGTLVLIDAGRVPSPGTRVEPVVVDDLTQAMPDRAP